MITDGNKCQQKALKGLSRDGVLHRSLPLAVNGA